MVEDPMVVVMVDHGNDLLRLLFIFKNLQIKFL